MNTESFKGMSNNYVFFKLWFYSMIRIVKSTYTNMREMRKKKQEYLDAKNCFKRGMDIFTQR